MDTQNTTLIDDKITIASKAWIVRALYQGRDLAHQWEILMERVSADMSDAAAFFDLATILYSLGRFDDAAVSQTAALSISRNFRIRNGKGTGLTVLVFAVAGDFMTNTPIEFLLEHSDTTLVLHFVDAATENIDNLPEHDIAFVGIGESPANQAVLDTLDRLLAGYEGPVMNRATASIRNLTRDNVARLLKDEPSILAPATTRLRREELEQLAAGLIDVADIGLDTYPFIVRPAWSHAGNGLEKVSAATDLAPYLESTDEVDFFVAPFIDYSGPDGRFRKQRIAFIDGRAFASHLAVSDHWMVHYLSAGMGQYEDRRIEEASWMANFDRDFAARHARAFDVLHRHLGLDYFAIDCAELADGRLLVFEADVAMIVHSMDAEEVFPYKVEPMRKLFRAFENALMRRVVRARGSYGGVTCAHTGQPAVYQRTDNDCLICSLAMLTGRNYDDIEAIAQACDPDFPLGGPMSHSVMRGVANKLGFVLLSSIYMLWTKPAIIGVVSPTIPNTGHAVVWDGEKIIDPGLSRRVDRAYVDRWGLEFTQRAKDLQPLLALDTPAGYTASAVTTGEPL